MKSKREESFKKVEGETFYTSPPYNYRPSIAEYLTQLNVTKKGFIADIMHLDYKGNIKIKSIKDDILQIKLIDNKDLNLTEVFIWNFLLSKEKNKEINLDINQIPKSVLSQFSSLVIIKTSQKFNSGIFKFNYNLNNEDINQYKNALFVYRISIGIILNFFGFLSFIAFIAGLSKLSKQKSDTQFFFKKFVWRYFLISLIYFVFLILFLIVTSDLLKNLGILILIPLLFVGLIWLMFFYQYSKIAYDYISWLFESKEAAENRSDWLKFKSFVIKNSEIEKSPIGHYTLWGPFYYYTLAVGGIKKYALR